jgi:hypothetical protein
MHVWGVCVCGGVQLGRSYREMEQMSPGTSALLMRLRMNTMSFAVFH